MKFKAILELLRADGSIIVNKKLAKEIGLNEAVMYSELISKHLYFEISNQLSDEYFYNSMENLKKDTTLSRYQQGKAIEKLVKLGLIEYKLKGLPATRYFKIIESDIILNILSRDVANKYVRNSQSCMQESNKQEVKKVASNNTNINNTKNNTNINNNGKLKLTEDVKEIFEYWKNTLNHPKAIYSNDRINKIKARLKEGFTVDDCKKAIDSISKSPYHMGDNDKNKKYDSVEMIFRNADKLEWYINNNNNSKKSQDDILKEWNNEKE